MLVAVLAVGVNSGRFRSLDQRVGGTLVQPTEAGKFLLIIFLCRGTCTTACTGSSI
ncbi:MAG: hypothetical protein R3A10_19555 [Caldilineaceae bacterium]